VPSWQRNIFDDGKGQLAEVFAVRLLNLLNGLLTAYCRSYVVAARVEGIEDVSRDETRSSCDQDGLTAPRGAAQIAAAEDILNLCFDCVHSFGFKVELIDICT